MNRIFNAVTASVFAAALCVGASAQDHGNDHKDDGHGNQGQAQHADNNHGGPGQQHNNNQYVRHTDWHKGSRLAPNDWNRGDRIDAHGGKDMARADFSGGAGGARRGAEAISVVARCGRFDV